MTATLRAEIRASMLLDFRNRKGWTQEEAAEWFGCTARSWSRYETGARKTPQPLVNRIMSSYPKIRPKPGHKNSGLRA